MNFEDHHQYSREIVTAIRAVREAAKLCREVQAQIAKGTISKKDRSPVTLADFGSQALICRAIGEFFPNDPVIAEEDSSELRKPDNRPLLDRLVDHIRDLRPGSTPEAVCRWIDRGGVSEYSDRFWSLDPIDGTKGFLRGDQYAISLCLIVNGELTVAALGCPNLPADLSGNGEKGVVFSAVKGGGTFQHFLWPKQENTRPRQVFVSETWHPSEIRFCESVEAAHSSHADAARIAQKLSITASPVRIDSQAKYAIVSRGQGDAYLRLPKSADYQEKIWDHAGGALIVQEAGGKVTDIHGQPLEFNHGRTLAANRGIIVTNSLVHDPIINAIAELNIGT